VTRKGRSLFWVIVAALSLTAIIGTFAQTLVVDAVLRPLESRDTRARARLAVSRMVAQFAAREQRPDSAAVAVMLERTVEDVDLRSGTVLYRDDQGWDVGHPSRRTQAALEFLDQGAPQPGAEQRPGGPRNYMVFAREPALWKGQKVGELISLRPTRGPMGPGSPFANALLLSLPIALAASLAVGVVIVRMLVRRLRGLELLASRVAGGDLTVRVADDSSLDAAFWADYREANSIDESDGASVVTLRRTDRYRGLAFPVFRFFVMRRRITFISGSSGKKTRACCFSHGPAPWS